MLRPMPADTAAIEELERFAVGYDDDRLGIHGVSTRLDVNLDLEPVLRIRLLLRDPDAATWDLDHVTAMRRAFQRKAVELGLPYLSFSLVPDSDPQAAELFPH